MSIKNLLTVCENGGDETYNHPKNIELTTRYSNEYFTLLGFKIGARDWKSISDTDRFVKLVVPEITEEIIDDGAVILYLNEIGKYVSLPFKYYQLKSVLLFQPSYEKGQAYISVLGNFILAVNSYYHFEILILNKKGQLHYKKLNLYNYRVLQSILDGEVL